MRIDDGQIHRPQQLARVEPQGVGRDEDPINDGVPQGNGFPGLVKSCVRHHGDQPHHEERGHPKQVSGGHAAPLPPVPDQQCRGQGDHDGLAQQPQHEQRQRQKVAPPSELRARFLRKVNPSREGSEIEQGREQVLALNHPGNGFHVQGMNGEHRGEQPGAGHGQPPGQAPQQQRVAQVQHHVDDVIAGRGVPPQLVLQPEGRIDQRPVVPFARDLRG